MFNVLSIRRLAIGVAYFGAAAATIGLTRFDGGLAYLWLATAVLVGALKTSDPRSWPSIMLSCSVAGMLATTWVGLGPEAALPLAIANLAEGLVVAVVMRRVARQKRTLDSLQWLFAFVLMGGVVGPAAGAALGAPFIAHLLDRPFADVAVQWFVAHALGTLTFAPIATMVLRGHVSAWWRGTSRYRRSEAVLIMVGVTVSTFLVFAQNTYPLLFVPLLPLILATFRLGKIGAAGSVVIIAVIGAKQTLDGLGPINLLHGTTGARMQFLQLYLTITVLTVLPLATALSHRFRLFKRLEESEMRHRLLIEHSCDAIFSMEADGTITYASPSVDRIAGFRPADLVGKNALSFVVPQDRAAVQAVHLEALSRPECTHRVDYRAVTANGSPRWFEANAQAVLDPDRRTMTVVSAIRDVTERKMLEMQLERAALTDALTQLPNRRAFMNALRECLTRDQEKMCGHIAILDIDHFKRINDDFGHDVGDRVLSKAANLMREKVRTGEVIARIGGEEFALLLPYATASEAKMAIDRVRGALCAEPLDVSCGSIDLTASAGIAPFASGGSPEAVLKAADEALYRAKADGRNRSRLAA